MKKLIIALSIVLMILIVRMDINSDVRNGISGETVYIEKSTSYKPSDKYEAFVATEVGRNVGGYQTNAGYNAHIRREELSESDKEELVNILGISVDILDNKESYTISGEDFILKQHKYSESSQEIYLLLQNQLINQEYIALEEMLPGYTVTQVVGENQKEFVIIENAPSLMSNRGWYVEDGEPVCVRIELLIEEESVEEVRVIVRAWHMGSVLSPQDMESLKIIAEYIGMDEEEADLFVYRLIEVVDNPNLKIKEKIGGWSYQLRKIDRGSGNGWSDTDNVLIEATLTK